MLKNYIKKLIPNYYSKHKVGISLTILLCQLVFYLVVWLVYKNDIFHIFKDM